MASPDAYDDDGYSDEEEDEEDWQDTDTVGAWESWNKDHQVKSSQISDLVSVRDFKTLCRKSVQSLVDGSFDQARSNKTNLFTASELGLTISELTKLKDEMDPKKLLPTDGFPGLRRLDLSKVVSEESCFKSFKHHKLLRNILRKNPVTYGYNLVGSEPVKECPAKVPPGEVVLSVTVFHPINKQRDQEFVVLGSQKLTELRDNIVCHNDFFIKKDFSESPSSYHEQVDSLPNPPNVSPSAFFFINNTFYNDRRHSDSVDLSKPIMEWASVKERQQLARRVEQFTTDNMADTTFEELSLRLGYPYLFAHHTDCEHLIKFTDMRMFHQGVDPPSLVQYPRLSYRHRRQAIKCRMCRAAQPQWVTFNDDLATCSPCHFCEDCFTQFHYSKEGKKIGNFEAYPFHPTSH